MEDKQTIVQEESIQTKLKKAQKLFVAGKLDDAIAFYKEILELNPDSYIVCHNLGVAFAQNNDEDNAIAYLKKAVELKPDYIEALLNVARFYYLKCNFEEAMSYYQKILESVPENTKALYGLGMCYYDRDDKNTAITYLKKVVELEPEKFEVLCNLGTAFLKTGDINNAIIHLKKAVELKPESFEALNNIGMALLRTNDEDTAIDYFKKVLELKPDHILAFINLISAYIRKNNAEEAKYYLNRACELTPEDAELKFSLGLKFLSLGDFEKGFELWEQRFFKKTMSPHLIKVPKPKWDGSDIEGKTIFVSSEQGMGDIIQFIRYVPELIKLGAKVILTPQKELIRLFKHNNFGAEILERPVKASELDTYTYILSLPYLLKSNINNISCKTRYLEIDNGRVKFYKENYFNNDNFKIGIFWQGQPQYPGDKYRSIPLKHFLRLKNLPNIKIYSLQKGYGLDQIDDISDEMEIVRLGETFEDFYDTAAAMENLDLIIGSDTALAHLAGALGKPMWLLLCKECDWRWSYNLDYSYWYDSMKIFRQKEFGNWDEVMERVISILQDLGQ